MGKAAFHKSSGEFWNIHHSIELSLTGAQAVGSYDPHTRHWTPEEWAGTSPGISGQGVPPTGAVSWTREANHVLHCWGAIKLGGGQREVCH